MSLNIPLKASNFGHHCAIIIGSTGTVLRVNQPGPEGVLVGTRATRDQAEVRSIAVGTGGINGISLPSGYLT